FRSAAANAAQLQDPDSCWRNFAIARGAAGQYNPLPVVFSLANQLAFPLGADKAWSPARDNASRQRAFPPLPPEPWPYGPDKTHVYQLQGPKQSRRNASPAVCRSK